MKTARYWILVIGCLLARSVGAAELPVAKESRVQFIPLADVKIQDPFWAPKIRVYREKTIPHSWFFMQWEMRSLRKAAGQMVEGDLNGTWGEANLYKFFETTAYSLAMGPDAELEKRTDEVIDLLAAGQQTDGYLHIYITNNKKLPWDPAFLDGSHDGYVLGHMIEAAIEHHAATGKTKFLDIARRAADQAYAHFLGTKGQPGFCGHAELEMALVELYRVTGEPRCLELAKAFVEWRGRGKVKPFSETPRAYFQDQVPLREQRTLEGHAVRAVFFATGVADLAIETQDPDYRLAANRFWDSTTLRRMTITGSVGPRQEHEAFGEDYELPNTGYYESCAACGLADLAQRMFMLERRTESADVLERVLYNAIPHGISLDGTNTYYQNPLSDHDHLRDNCWVCCPPNLSRTLLQIGRYAYAHTDRELYVNLFVGGGCKARLGQGTIGLNVDTEYPWKGDVKLTVQVDKPTRFALLMRQPGWCAKSNLKLNGESIATADILERGYLRLDREWRKDDRIELSMDMPVQRMIAHPNIMDCRGKVALQRGPIVYGFEGLDNNKEIILDENQQFHVEHRSDMLGGVTVIEGTTSQGGKWLAIPFYTLANRGKSTQEVWVPQRNLKIDNSWWMGRLYRPL